MKKFLSTFAVAGVAVVALASCGGGNTPDPTPEEEVDKWNPETDGYVAEGESLDSIDKNITIWVSETEGVATDTKAAAEKWLTDNAAQVGSGWTVSVEGVSEGDAGGQVLQDLDAAPDIYCFAQDQLARLVANNAICAERQYYQTKVKENNDNTSILASTVGKDVYAFPLTSDNGYVMYYDKAVLNGVDMNSLEDIIAKCEETGKNFSWNLSNAWFSAGFFFGCGATSTWQTDSEGNFVSFVDTFNQVGLPGMKGMYKLLSSTAFNDKKSASEFAAATPSAVVITGSWDTTTAKAALGENYAVCKLPSYTVDGKTYQIGSFSGCKLMGVKPQTKLTRINILEGLANYLAGEECQTERFTKYEWGGCNLNLQKTDAFKANEAIAALSAQAAFATPQGQIFGSWWTIANNLATSAKDTDGSDAALQKVLDDYKTALDEAIQLQGMMLVGQWQGWKNTDAKSIMTKDGTKWSYEFTITEDVSYKGGRVVKAGTWDTMANYSKVDEASKALLDVTACEDAGNGDGNIIFAEAGTYVLTYDTANETVSIVKK